MKTFENNKDDALNPDVGEIILYQPDNSVKLDVRVAEETVWLNRQQMSQLFDRDVKTIGKHINNALREELQDFSVVAKFATTAADGKTYQMEYYGLDIILSVGYRVKSQRGIQFRIWSNHILKEHLLKGFVTGLRIERLEHRVTETEKKIDFVVKTALTSSLEWKFQNEMMQLRQYIENVLADYNDINEDTRMQLELINEALAKLQSDHKLINKPRNPIGFKTVKE